MPGTRRRRGLGVAAAGALVLALAPAGADESQQSRDELAGLVEAFDRSLSSRADDAERRGLRARLAALTREKLASSDWIDLHIAIRAIDRRLDPPPERVLRDGVPDPADGSDDPFDVACRIAGLAPAGRAHFAWSLRRIHGLAVTPEAVLQVGRMARAAIAREIDERTPHDGSWHEMVEHCRDDHPASIEELLATCHELVRDAGDLAERFGLVTIPERARDLEVLVAERASPLPYARYRPPRFGSLRSHPAQISVPPIPHTFAPEDVDAWLRDFDVHFLRIVAAHEGVPGHHLQHVRSRQVRSRVRAHGFNTTFAEGWAFYAEGLVERAWETPCVEDRVAALRARSWRAVRCYADAALHLGRITPSEAVTLLMDEAGFSRRAAEADVRTILRHPARMFGYWVGRRLIERMHDDYVRRNGPGTSREFHDRLLSFGTIPLPLARAVLLDERAAYDARNP